MFGLFLMWSSSSPWPDRNRLAAGLIVNSGIDMMAGAIAGAALFVVMASSHYVIARQASLRHRRRPPSTSSKKPLSSSMATLQRIDQVEDDVARLDLLTDRVERLDQAIPNMVAARRQLA